MATHPLTDEQLQEAVDALKENNGNKQAAADSLSMPRPTFQNRIRRAAERGMLGTAPVMEGFRIARVSTQQNEEGSVTKTFIQQKPELGPEFELPKGHMIKGVSALVDADGRTIQQWIKTRTDTAMPHLVQALEAIFEKHKGTSPAELIPVHPLATFSSDLLSVYPIADQHNGMLSWGDETGEDYDIEIGVKRLKECMVRLVEQSPKSKQAIILNLGDYQHTDDMKNMTPGHGNILDVDSRYFKILTAGIQLMQDCINMALQKHENVLVKNIPGNHDPHASIALTVALNAHYHNNPRVKIDMTPGDWFFHRFGETLIGATHGHKLKPEKMAMAMAVMRREDWGATKYHWMMFGHIHHETAKEIGDVRVESFQTLAAKDAYAVGGGYTSGQSLQSITLHREGGEIGRHRVNICPIIRREKNGKTGLSRGTNLEPQQSGSERLA